MSVRGSRARGFTLVEAVCAMAVIAALGSIGAGLVFSGVRSYRDAAGLSQIHEEASNALEVIVRELRGIPQGTGGAPNISSVTATSITFGTSSVALQGTDLMWVDSGAAAVRLLSGVTGFGIQCYDAANSPLAANLSGASVAAIRRVGVTIMAARDTSTERLETKVFLRCFMEGATP